MNVLRTYMMVLFVFLAGGPVFGWVNPDTNNDGKVNLLDLRDQSANWLAEGVLIEGNFNGDNIVDPQDLAATADNWLGEVFPIPVGVELFQTQEGFLDFTSQPIPAGFFDPGSEPFTGGVPLVGAPLETSGPFELGLTDTIIQRTDHSLLRGDGDTVTVPIEIVELSLRSIQPITVMVDGQPTEWDVQVGLAPEPPMEEPAEPEGQMTLHSTGSPPGGQCDIVLPVKPVIVFSRFTETRVLELGEVVLQGTGGSFNPIGLSCPASELTVPYMATDFCIFTPLNSPVMSLFVGPAQVNPSRPSPNVHPDAVVDPAVGSLGRFCQIGPFASVGPECVVGPFAQIRPEGSLGARCLIDRDVVIGDGCQLGNQVIVRAGSQLGAGTIVEDGVIIGANCSIGDFVFIGANSVIESDCVIESGATVGPHNVISFNSFVGSSAFLHNDLFLARGAIVDPDRILGESLLTCSEPLSHGNYVGTPLECHESGGVVYCPTFDYPADLRRSDVAASAEEEVDLITGDDPCRPAWVDEALEDLRELKTHDPNYSILDEPNQALEIVKRAYNDPCYMCGDFSHDAERGLSELKDPCDPTQPKYDEITFTCYWRYHPNPAYDPLLGDQPGNRKWLSGTAHVVIDVHNDGKIIWLEPQAGGSIVSLDFDGDGKVEYWDNPPAHKPFPPPDNVMTDDHVKIEVFPDRETAKNAGAPIG